MAEGGPPEIEWQSASVLSNEPLARGTNLLRVKAAEATGYLPGHIIGFEIESPETGEGPLKGPYTVTRCNENEFDIVYRVIPDGRKTPFTALLKPTDAVRFGGRFGTPIAEGIASDVDKVIGIATGAGLGPLVGYAESCLTAADGPQRIELYSGFRDLADVCAGEAMSRLVDENPGRFKFLPCISKPMACTAVGLAGMQPAADSPFASLETPQPAFAQGRVSSVVPGQLDEVTERTHFHLIGRGEMVEDFKNGLLKGGVSEERITTEKYFNGKAEADPAVVDFIAEAVAQKLVGQAATRA